MSFSRSPIKVRAAEVLRFLDGHHGEEGDGGATEAGRRQRPYTEEGSYGEQEERVLGMEDVEAEMQTQRTQKQSRAEK